MTSARVVGAGLSGLAAAWHLASAGVEVEVLEEASRPGGLIETVSTPYGIVERAANGFLWDDSVTRLFASLGLEPRFAAPYARRRFIYRDGRPRRWPLGPLETTGMAARAATTRLLGRAAPAGRETVADWSRRAWGRAATEWLISPALQGVYGAPAERLAARAILGLGEGRMNARRRSVLAAADGGMSRVMERLVAALQERGAKVEFCRGVSALDPSIPTIIATSARSAGRLVRPHAPMLGDALANLDMNSLAMVTAVFARQADDVRGFGILYPRGEGFRTLGVRIDSDIFPAEPGSGWRMETWISSIDPKQVPGDDELWQSVADDRRRLTGRSDQPVAVMTTVRPDALPLYGAGVLDIRDRLADLPPWLALTGNYLGRIGAARLVDVAADAAARVRGARSDGPA